MRNIFYVAFLLNLLLGSLSFATPSIDDPKINLAGDEDINQDPKFIEYSAHIEKYMHYQKTLKNLIVNSKTAKNLSEHEQFESEIKEARLKLFRLFEEFEFFLTHNLERYMTPTDFIVDVKLLIDSAKAKAFLKSERISYRDYDDIFFGVFKSEFYKLQSKKDYSSLAWWEFNGEYKDYVGVIFGYPKYWSVNTALLWSGHEFAPQADSKDLENAKRDECRRVEQERLEKQKEAEKVEEDNRTKHRPFWKKLFRKY